MKTAVFLFALLFPFYAQAVSGPRAPASCRAIIQSKLGEAMRERAWELSRARTLLDRAIASYRKRCYSMQNDLRESSQLREVDELKSRLSTENAKMQDLSDDYVRAAREAMEAAHALREQVCEDRLREEKNKVEEYGATKQTEVANYIAYYCR